MDLHTDSLDELVHDLAAKLGSTVNNDGMERQVQFVIEQLGTHNAIEAIEKVIRER